MSNSSTHRGRDASRHKDDPPPANNPSADLVPLRDQLDDIQKVDLSIKSSILSKRGDALGLDQLATVVQASVDGIKSLLQDQTHITKAADKRLDECVRQLLNVDDHLRDPKAYGTSAKAKGKLRALAFRPYDPYSSYRERLQGAFDEFQEAGKFQDRNQNVPAVSNTPGTQHLVSPVSEIIAESVEKKPSPPDGRWATIRDAIQGVLKVATDVKDIVGEPAGPIIGLLAGTGLTIIEMLNDMEDNREDAADLGVRISELLQIIAGFLKHRRSTQSGVMYTTTLTRLRSFSRTMESVKEDLAALKKQGRFKQGVSHSRNKEDLQGWSSKIDDARNTLQLQLSLHNVDATEATGHGVDDLRLLGLLGDGDTGASEKVADLDDLVCLPGTREDILGKAQTWLNNPDGSRVFWVSGVAGCGKSAVAATIADRQTKTGARVAVFHFARANQARNKRVLCSLAHQASEWDGGLIKHRILSALREDAHLATKPVATQFQHLLMNTLKDLPSSHDVTLLVLDALDEWDDHGAAIKLLDLITDSNPHFPPTIRFVLTSRNESHLVNRLISMSMQPLVTRYTLDTIPETNANHDIRVYVEKRFAKIRSASNSRAPLGADWPGEESIGLMVKEAGGLFQWAATAMSYVEASGPFRRLREILEHSERYNGLENLYQGILSMLFTKESPEVLKLLQDVLGAILVSPVPINLTTIAYMCCGAAEDVPETTERVQDDVLAHLGALLIIPDGPLDPIKVAHPTVFDIFTTATKCTDPRFYIDVVAHHQRQALTCLSGMTRDLEPSVCSILDVTKTSAELRDQALNDIPAGIQYASQHWGHHLLRSCHHKDQTEAGTAPTPSTLVRSDSTIGQVERCTSDGSATTLHKYLNDFCTHTLINWLEVLSLTGLAGSAVSIAIAASRWYSLHISMSSYTVTQSLLNDIRRFSATCLNPISTSAAHIRPFILPLAPKDTELFRHYLKPSSRRLKVSRGPLDRGWPAALWTARHTSAVMCLSMSSDGRTIASGTFDGTVWLWDVDSGAQKGKALTGHKKGVRCLAISSDGSMVASGSSDNTVRLWDVDSGAQKGDSLTGHKEGVGCLAISSDGSMVASGSDDSTVRLWDVDSGAQKGNALTGHTRDVTCLAISSDGSMVASGSSDNTVRLWDVDSGAQKGEALTGHTDTVRCLVMSSDGSVVASGSHDSTVRLWDVDSGAQKGDSLTGHTDWVVCLAISSDGSVVASGSVDRTVRLWDVGSGAQKGDALTGHTDWVVCLAISSDGSVVASGSEDSTVRLWDADSGAQKGEALTGHAEIVTCLAISSDGSVVASGSCDTTVRLWDADSGAQKGEALTGHKWTVTCLAISPDGSMVASGSFDGTVRLWDADSGAQKGGALTGHKGVVACLVISPDGSVVASGSHDRTVRLWDVDSGAQKGDALTGHRDMVRCLAMSSDGSMVASGSVDRTVRLWDVGSGAQKGDALTGHKGVVACLVISPDGSMVASGSYDSTVRLWDVGAGAQKGEALTGHTEAVTCLAISPDGSMVASGSDDRTVRLWDVDSGAQKGDTLTGYTGWVRCLAISSGGLQLTSHSDDGVRTWDLSGSDPSLMLDGLDTDHMGLMSGNIAPDGWIWFQTRRLFWLPVQSGEWISHGTRLVVLSGNRVFIFDVSGIMFVVE